MDMTDKDNIMIEDFFKQAAQQQIEDNGFTERVMASLPSTSSSWVRRMSRLWTSFCLAVGALLFFAFDGWEVLKVNLRMLFSTLVTSLEVFITTAPTADLRLSLPTILLALAFVLVFLPYQIGRKLSSAL